MSPRLGSTHGPHGKGARAAGGVGESGAIPCQACGSTKNVRRGGDFVTTDGVTRVRYAWLCAPCWGEGDWPKRPEAA